MKAIIMILCLLCYFALGADPAPAAPITSLTEEQFQGLFSRFVDRYQKKYETPEFAKRFAIFKDNLQYILNWNADKNNTHELGMNQFGDMTEEEWTKYYGFKAPENLPPVAAENNPDEVLKDVKVKDSIDWRAEGKVPPVFNQGSCGSCWAWSTMSSVETAWAIAGNELVVGSVQQLVDCDRNNNGCGGGWMNTALSYLHKNGGACLAKDYKYRGRRGRCQNCEKVMTIPGYYDLRGQNESALKKALNIGNVAIAVPAGSRSFMYYKSGIITRGCGGQLSHAVNLVGYDKDEKGTEYYIMRNSWGLGWGDKGYAKIAIGNNVCKVMGHPVLPKQVLKA